MDISTSTQLQSKSQYDLNKLFTPEFFAENIPDLVCVHNTDGIFEFVSDSSIKLLGYQPQELLGKSFFDFVFAEELVCVREELRSHLQSKTKEDFKVECRLVKNTGEPVWVEISVRKILDNGENRERYLTVSRDNNHHKNSADEDKAIEEKLAQIYFDQQTARTKAEAAEREKDIANRAKDEFLQLISHEFRTPLTTIKTLSRILQQGGETLEERNEYLETIVSECNRQLNMILNLLDVAHIEDGNTKIHIEKVDINNVLRACDKIHRHAANERNQSFEVLTDEDLPFVCGDEKTLRRAICSIIENAIKYTQFGGKIVVTAELTTRIADKSYLKAETVGIELAPTYKPQESEKYNIEEIAVRIIDNGRGIHAEDIPLLFQKFFRGRHIVPHDQTTDGTPDDAKGRAETPGVGLGLYLAKKLITGLEGRIEVESEIGRGSCFTVYLKTWSDEDELNHNRDSHLPAG